MPKDFWSGGGAMTCKTCGSENVSTFPAEVAIHFPGLKNIDVPVVFVFPQLDICLHCGAILPFEIPAEELRLLQKRRAARAS